MLPVTHQFGAKIRCYLLDHPELEKPQRDRLVAAARVLESADTQTVAFDLMGRVSMEDLFNDYCGHLYQRLGLTDASKVLNINPSSLWRRAQKLQEKPYKPRTPQRRPRSHNGGRSPQKPSMGSHRQAPPARKKTSGVRKG